MSKLKEEVDYSRAKQWQEYTEYTVEHLLTATSLQQPESFLSKWPLKRDKDIAIVFMS